MPDTDKDLQFEVQFFEALLVEDENFVDALVPLGDAYTILGEYEKGLKVDLKLSRLRPDDPTVHYNLACSFSLLDEIDLAYNSLNRAIGLGYTDFKHMLQDSDMKNLISDEGFPAFLENTMEKSKNRSQ